MHKSYMFKYICRSTSNVEMTNKGANDEKHNTAGYNSEMNKKTQSEECRACLQPTGSQTAYSLFESWVTPWAVRGAIIADDLSKFADVEISEYDKYSKVICSKCYSRLSDACTFMITVQMSDSILRQRVENSDSNTAGEVGTSWPQPILLNKSKDIDGDNNIEVEVKQEVLSDDNAEENEADMDQDWEPTMDIKIEPEEITAPVQSIAQVNGVPDGIRDEIPNLVEITDTSSKHKQDDSMDRVIKQEPLSEDELLEPMPDLPLDCMLCSKVFHTMSGLKAHVISQHSYKSVKRKAVGGSSPVKNKVQVKEHVCNLCNQSFSTSTDLMVHGASHSEHVCYVCDRKFNSFQQLMRHTPRCQKKHASAHRRDHTRFVLRPQQSQPVKESIKALKPPACPEEVTQELSQPLKNTLKPENPPTRMEKTKPKSEMPVIKDVASVTESPVIKALARTESKSLAIEDMLATESEVLATKAMIVTESERSKTEDMVATESESLAIEPMMVIKSERPVIEPMEVTKSENPIIEVMVATKSESPVKEAIVAIECVSPTVEAIVATESKSPAVEAIVATELKNPAIDEMIATKSESPAIEDMIAERVQELVETWPSTEEMDMDIELSQTHSENKLEYKPQVPLGKEQQNYDISSEKDLEMRLSAIFNGPCLISTKVEMEIKPSIEITQKSGQESKSSHSQVEIEESSQKQVESSLIETQKGIREETKVQKEAQNELSCDTTYVESIEEIQRESITESPMQNLEIALAKTSDKPDSSEDIPSTFLEDTISNSLHNINEDGLSLPKVLSETQNESNFLSESQNYRNFISESVPSLPKQDDSKEIFINDTGETLKESKIESYNLATGEEIEQTIEENVDLENSTQNNLDNNDVPGTKTLDDISEMKVHLAINPLNKDTVIFEAEAEGIEHGESESCEPILVSLISEHSDIKHT